MIQTILVIDDSPEIHSLIAARLKHEGVALVHAPDALTGIARAVEQPPDLILLDVDMPTMDGFEACIRLKSTPATAAVPVVFLTGATDLATKVKGFDLGAVDYVTKPFEPAELRARVRAALRTKRFQDLLATRANVDALTGLGNRAFFDTRLHEEVSAFSRYERPFSLVMIDLDHFKVLNDTHGHPTGDRALQLVGEFLANASRPTDVACRYGGEEFALILRETASSGASALCQRLCTGIASLELRGQRALVPLSASLGWVSTDKWPLTTAVTGTALLEAADRALYEAKRLGRNRSCMAAAA